MPYSTVSPQTLYQAKPEFQTKLVKARQHLHQRLKPHLNQTVRVQTMDHHVYEGTIVHMDADHLYIRVPQPYHSPSPGTPPPLPSLYLQQCHSTVGTVHAASDDTAELTNDAFSS